MGICRCIRDGTYDVMSERQGNVHLTFAIIYFIIEAVYAWKSTVALKRNKSLRRLPIVILMNTCVHILLIGNVLYFLGGTLICYHKFTYLLLSGFTTSFVSILVYLTVYLMEGYILFVRKRKKGLNFPQIFAIVVAIFNSITSFIDVVLVAYVGGVFNKSFLYHCYFWLNVFNTFVFTYTALKVIKAMRDFPYMFHVREWRILIVAIYLHLNIYVLYALYLHIYRIYWYNINDKSAIGGRVIVGLLHLTSDVIPGLIIIWFIFTKKAINTTAHSPKLGSPEISTQYY
eukprot:TRINITY_DN15202_c0_g2_i2.p1 TRINITY_DN15202_c0_g2~~TRINITY_DN15202_c0_g2_i2.p1  ORF type:complete len:287 (-),score=-12.11 TRINITY_DN15202_c0_g2_i2:85-945(-)